MGGLSITGYVLEPPRVGAANSAFTSTPNVYISNQAAFDAAYPSNESAPRTEYHVFVLVDGDFPDCTFCWTKNEIVNRFDYDGRQQRFRTLPGSVLDELGDLGPDSNTNRLVVAIPASSDLVLDPVRVSVGSGIGTAFTVVLVALDVDLNNPDPPVGTVQISQESGSLGWAPADLGTFNVQPVRFQRQSFYTRSESSGRLGAIEDTLLLNPLPATGQFPLIRIGFQEYLTPVEVASLGLPASGTVEWDRGTGELRFSATDAATYAGEFVYYDGSVFSFGQTVSVTALGTVGSPGSLSPVPPEESDLFFRVPGVVQFAETTYVGSFSATGKRGVVEVDRGTGAVQFSAADQAAYGSESVQAIVADLDVERGMTLRMFRTPVDLAATDPTTIDVTAFHSTEGASWADPVIGAPSVNLPATPVEGRPLEVRIAQGTGTFPAGTFPDLDVASPPSGYGYVFDLDEGVLNYARRQNGQIVSASSVGNFRLRVSGPYGSLQLPNPLVFEEQFALELEDTAGGGAAYPSTVGWTNLVLGETALFDYTSGLITFVNTEGVLYANGGGDFSGTIFTDTDQDFVAAGVQSGDLLIVTTGVAQGVYTVDAVGTTSLTVDVSGGVESDLVYEVRRGSEILADRYFENISDVDPNTVVERLINMGVTQAGSSIDTTYIDSYRFRFGTSTFSTSVTKVANAGAFTPPASLGAGEVEIAEDTGEVNFSQTDIDAGFDVYSARALTLGVDYEIQSALGLISFTDRMLENEEVFVTYAVLDEDNKVIVEERGRFIVRKEVTQDHPSATDTLGFNPLGREIADEPSPEAFRGGRPQSSSQVTFDLTASTVRFLSDSQVTDALPHGSSVQPTERVYVDYYVYGAVGGEKNFTVLRAPMFGPVVNIEADETEFTVIGDRTSDLISNRLMRLDGTEIYLIGASTYNLTNDTTTVVLASPQVFRSDLLNPSVEVTSGEVRVNTVGFFPSYFVTEISSWPAVPRGANRIYIPGDVTRTYVSGTVTLFTDGGTVLDFNRVTGSVYDSDLDRTEVVLTSNGISQYNNGTITLKYSSRPVLDGTATTATTSSSPVLSEPFLVYRRVEGQAGEILSQPEGYSVNDSGQVILTSPLQESEEFAILYTGTNLIDAGRRVRASYTHSIVPTDNNGINGQILKADYTTYLPDTFYFRVETFTNFRAELVEQYEEDVQATIPTAGPRLENMSQLRLYEQGRESIFFTEGRLFNEDEVARPTLKYFNDGVNYLEDALQHMDGRVVGGHDGRFLFDGLIDNPTRDTYSEVTNQIDDLLKIAEPPLKFSLNPFSFTWIGTYQEAYKAATSSRFYPTYRRLFSPAVDGAETGDTIAETGFTNLSSVQSVSRRLPWSIVTQEAPAGSSTLVVDSTEEEEDLLRPAWPDPATVDSILVIQGRDGSWLIPDGSPPNTDPARDLNSKTSGSLTIAGTLPLDVPVGATVYHIPNYDSTHSQAPSKPYLRTYRVGFDVGVNLEDGVLTYIKPYPPYDGSFPSIPAELKIQPPAQGEFVDIDAYLVNTLTSPYRFPALDGGTTDDDGNRSFPLLTPDPESELGLSRTVNGSASPDIGALPLQTSNITSIQSITTDALTGTGSLDATKTVLTNLGGVWGAPVPQIGDVVAILDGLNGLTDYHQVTAVGGDNVTVSPAFLAQDTGFSWVMSATSSLVFGTGTLTTATQLDDVTGDFIANGVQVGHTVVISSLQERRQVVAVNSATQLFVEAFSVTGAVTYRIDDSVLTYGGTGSFLEKVVEELDIQEDALLSNAPPTRPWAQVEALERFIEHVATDVFVSSSGQTTAASPSLTDMAADFTASGVDSTHFVYVRSGLNAGIYRIDQVTSSTTLDVDSTTPFPDTTGALSYRILDAYGVTILTLSAAVQALLNADAAVASLQTFRTLVTTSVIVDGDPGAFARRTVYSDLSGRLAEIASRTTELTDPSTGDIVALEDAMSTGDRLYDVRMTWIETRTNLRIGVLPKKDRAVNNREEAAQETLSQLTKLLTLRNL